MTSSSLAAAKSSLAPNGVLHVGLNLSNFLLIAPNPVGNDYRGVAPDLARELGKRLDLPVTFVPYDVPGKMADAVDSGAWDIAFFAIEPLRAAVVNFSAAYLEIESTYLVPAGSPLQSIADVDQPGVRISVMNRSAYELYLTRHLKHAQLVHAASIEESFQQFVDQKLDVLSGLRPRLVMDAAKLPGSRILDGRFTAVQQAVGTPRSKGAGSPGGSDAGAEYLRAFVEEAKASGLVAALIERNGAKGVNVAPAA